MSIVASPYGHWTYVYVAYVNNKSTTTVSGYAKPVDCISFNGEEITKRKAENTVNVNINTSTLPAGAYAGTIKFTIKVG